MDRNSDVRSGSSARSNGLPKDEDVAMAMRRIGEIMKRRKDVVHSAKCGSINALRDLCDSFFTSAEFVTVDAIDATFVHLKASNIPPMEKLGQRIVDELKIPIMAYTGLASLFIYPEVLQEEDIAELLTAHWPDVLSWTEFLFDVFIEKDLGSNAERQGITRYIPHIFEVFTSVSDALAKTVAVTPSVLRMGTQFWLTDDLAKTSYLNLERTPPGTTALIALLCDENKHEILGLMKNEGAGIVDFTLARIQKAVDENYLAEDDLDENFCCSIHSLLTILKSRPSHPLRLSFLSKGAVQVIPQLLCTLTARPAQSTAHLNMCIVSCFKYVFGAFYCAPGVQCVLQALSGGLLQAIVTCTTTLRRYDAEDQLSILKDFVTSFVPYLTHVPVLVMCDKFLMPLLEAGAGLLRTMLQSPIVKSIWDVFFHAFYQGCEILKPTEFYDWRSTMCDNCYKKDVESKYQRCGGCGLVVYCSKDCQTNAWKKKHRKECKNLKAGSTGSRAPSALHLNNASYLERLVTQEAWHNKEGLRVAAKGADRVRMDYTVIPWHFQSIVIGTKSSSDVGDASGLAVEQANSTSPRKEDRRVGSSMDLEVQTIIPVGNQVQVKNFLIAGFWDENVQKEHRDIADDDGEGDVEGEVTIASDIFEFGMGFMRADVTKPPPVEQQVKFRVPDIRFPLDSFP